ncbi:MAG: hypothetical protein FWH10_07145, partial [Oscillospiraceae bacterium]|nr:hypothetical protein [Oscillospiraceae bacterium]
NPNITIHNIVKQLEKGSNPPPPSLRDTPLNRRFAAEGGFGRNFFLGSLFEGAVARRRLGEFTGESS